VNLYLTPELQANRRGRFLASLLSISPSLEQTFPKEGFVLMIGEQLQTSAELQAEGMAWGRQPGCTLLLLPPYKAGSIFPFLDWVVEFKSSPLANADQTSLETILAGELSHRLQGSDGDCITDSSLDNLACHTRYWKAHSNSGLIAVTTLPLWSISLLDHADKVLAFLTELDNYTGKSSATIAREEPQTEPLLPEDITVLVCCYGFDLTTADSLSERLRGYAVPLLNLASFDLPESIRRLRCEGLIDDMSLTETGLAFLRASRYWPFAENLKGET
jgi:hypothetical protein